MWSTLCTFEALLSRQHRLLRRDTVAGLHFETLRTTDENVRGAPAQIALVCRTIPHAEPQWIRATVTPPWLEAVTLRAHEDGVLLQTYGADERVCTMVDHHFFFSLDGAVHSEGHQPLVDEEVFREMPFDGSFMHSALAPNELEEQRLRVIERLEGARCIELALARTENTLLLSAFPRGLRRPLWTAIVDTSGLIVFRCSLNVEENEVQLLLDADEIERSRPIKQVLRYTHDGHLLPER